MKRITAEEFTAISRFIYEKSGIHLDGSKTYLVETRLQRLLRETGSDSFDALYRKARFDADGVLEDRLIDAICTRETLFFRDSSPFELLRRKILPDLIARKTASASPSPARLNIWSAGCSTGQEVYSIAMVLKECLPNPSRFQIRLLGTDISDTALAGARSGEYSQVTVERGLPADKLNRYFTRTGVNWRIKGDIRGMCAFRKHNLMDPFHGLGRFDIVFCRNVAIYFKPEDKEKLFDKLANALEPGGSLIIGSSESLSGMTSRFRTVSESNMIYYQVKPQAARVAAHHPMG